MTFTRARRRTDMEQLYAETCVKQKTTAKATALKALWILGTVLLFGARLFVPSRLVILPGVASLVLLIWYWPRFKVEWEYVFCDGQLDFDRIQGGEKRKTMLRVELQDADVIAPMDSYRMDGYRHLAVRDFSSLNTAAKPYGIVIREEGREEKVVLVFEPSPKMLGMIQSKFPGKTEIRLGAEEQTK